MRNITFKTWVAAASMALVVEANAAGGVLPDNVSSCGLDIAARFDEGAPVDIFRIENRSTQVWSITSATYDLTSSRGKLIFDTDEGGNGVEVFQPFKQTGGKADLRRLSNLEDGSSSMTLDFDSFEAGEDFSFSIDVDDTLKASQLGQIRVAGSEIAGARIVLALRGPGGVVTRAEMLFGDQARASVTGGTC